jgi:hypothetical protein
MNTEDKGINNKLFIKNTMIKGLSLFIILNIVISFVPKGGKIGKFSLYNQVFPGRVRLPFGENPRNAYNLSLYDLVTMFASHEINAGPKPDEEFRVILIGDSATWGILLEPEDTIGGIINSNNLKSCDGRKVYTYNLAYPSMSLLKDLMILEIALTYDPDLIIWSITLESFPAKNQIQTPLVANNPHIVEPLIDRFELSVTDYMNDINQPSFWDLTLVGRRRSIFDALQLQFYGVLWAGTGIDQPYPINYTPAQQNFLEEDTMFHAWSPPFLPVEELSIDIIKAGQILAEGIPILIVNEPILISKGENSNIRYNYFYPRWAYDHYRAFIQDQAQHSGWHYVDLWDIIPATQFTNSAIHFTSQGAFLYYQQLEQPLKDMLCQK